MTFAVDAEDFKYSSQFFYPWLVTRKKSDFFIYYTSLVFWHFGYFYFALYTPRFYFESRTPPD